MNLAVAALSAGPSRSAMSALAVLLAAMTLAGCVGSRDAGPIGRTVYAGDVEPTVGRVQAVSIPALPSYAALPPENVAGSTTGPAEVAVAPAVARQPVAAPAAVASVPGSPPTVSTAGASPPTLVPAVTPPSVAAGTVAASAPQVATPPRVTPAAVTQPSPAPVIASAPVLGPSPIEETVIVDTTRVIPDPSERPPRSTDYPNLADVPDDPGNLPTADETAAIRAELEADRDAINRGETPPSVTEGSLMQTARERLRSTLSSPAAGGTASVTFEAGSSSLSLDALATLQSVALSQRETGDDVRLIGFAYASSEANRPLALGIALDRANTVASVLVSYGADPSAISVFANALTDVTQQDAANTRRVDITFQ